MSIAQKERWEIRKNKDKYGIIKLIKKIRKIKELIK